MTCTGAGLCESKQPAPFTVQRQINKNINAIVVNALSQMLIGKISRVAPCIRAITDAGSHLIRMCDIRIAANGEFGSIVPFQKRQQETPDRMIPEIR